LRRFSASFAESHSKLERILRGYHAYGDYAILVYGFGAGDRREAINL